MADYGAAGLFFTYLGEKYGGPDSFFKIVHRQEKGIDGVLAGLKEAGYPTQFAELFTRWAVANLADDESLGDAAHSFGYSSSLVQSVRGSVAALHELLPDLIPKLFQPTTRVKSFPMKGSESLRPQAAHYLELTGTGTLDVSFDGGGRPFEVFVLARRADDKYELYPMPLDSQTRIGSQQIPGLGSTISTVYLVVTNVAEDEGQAAEYRYEAKLE